MGCDLLVIAGLGNPGKEYQKTRHNAGFLVIDALAKDLGIKVEEKEFGANIGFYRAVPRAGEGRQKLLLVKPQGFMNLSGEPISAILRFYKLTPADLLVVLDDFNLELGSLRFKARGSAGGHNGLQSVIESLGTSDFKRLRLGLGAPASDHADYVLAAFSKAEKKKIDAAVDKAVEAILFLSQNGLEKTMSRYNAADKHE